MILSDMIILALTAALLVGYIHIMTHEPFISCTVTEYNQTVADCILEYPKAHGFIWEQLVATLMLATFILVLMVLYCVMPAIEYCQIRRANYLKCSSVPDTPPSHAAEPPKYNI